MIPLSNLHTHTHFCDGKDSPEEMVQAAIRAGFVSLGFSGHSFTPCDMSYCMLPESIPLYKAEIRSLLPQAVEGAALRPVGVFRLLLAAEARI